MACFEGRGMGCEINVFRKILIAGWFLLSALFADSFRCSVNSALLVDSVLTENFYHNFIIVGEFENNYS